MRGHCKREGPSVAYEDRARPSGDNGRSRLRQAARVDTRRRGAARDAAKNEEPEAATDVGRRRDAPRPVHRASESWRWRGALDNLPYRVRTAEAPPGRYILMFDDELAKWRRQLSAMPTSLHFAVRVIINKFLSCFRA